MDSVGHDFRYHAEIKYETEHGFDFTNAKGNTLKEFFSDLQAVLNKYLKDRRDPRVVQILDMKYFQKK